MLPLWQGLWRHFGKELRKLGWIEGKNIATEYRFAEGKLDRLPESCSGPGSSQG